MFGLIFLVFFGIVMWLAAPLAFPVYRWTQVDFELIAMEHKLKNVDLSVPRKMLLRYSPRNKKDPVPWQLVVFTSEETPSWVVDKEGNKVDEWQTLVRVDLRSDRTGEPPGTMFIQSNIAQDLYYEAEVWRLPPKSLGADHPRPVVLMKHSTMEKLDINMAKYRHEQIRTGLRRNDDGQWLTDDDPDFFPDRQDGIDGKVKY